MRTQLDLRSADSAQLSAARNEFYEGLSPAGKTAQGKLVLWAAGIPGTTGEEIDRIILDPKVQQELRYPDVDGVGLSQAVQSAAISHSRHLYDAMLQPFEKLMFITLLNGR